MHFKKQYMHINTQTNEKEIGKIMSNFIRVTLKLCLSLFIPVNLAKLPLAFFLTFEFFTYSSSVKGIEKK